MTHFRNFFFNLAGLTLVVQLAFAQAFAAPSFKGVDNPQGSEQERLRRVMDPATDIEEFRRELHDFLTEMEDAMRLFSEIAAVRQKFDQAGLQPLALLAETKKRLSELKPEELSQMRASYAIFPNWREAPRGINSLIKPELRQMLESKIAARRKSGGAVMAGIPDDCAAALAADHTNTDIAIAAGVLIGAEGVMEGLPTDGITIAFRLPAIAAVTAAKAALLAIQTLKNIKDDCNGAAFEASIQNQITNSTNTIVNNDNANKTEVLNSLTLAKNEIINNDNSNTTMIINNDNANKNELRDLLLRTQIEADLAEADNATPVAWYLTPTANGGHLNLVQAIVTQTIANIQAAGGNTGSAQSFLNEANAQKAAGQFKAAYMSYRKAYKAAAN
jgi:hypothetical protein